MSTVQKNILVVDDEKSLLFNFQTSLVAYSPDLRIYTAENGIEATKVLAQTRIDIVVTDLRMPEMDGFQLLIHMKKHHPEVPVIVMTGIGSPEVAERLKHLGTLQYLEKPVNIKDLAVKIFQQISSSSEGKIHGVTLSGFLQLVVMEEKTCLLKIRSKDRIGVLYIRKGELIDAKTRDLEGEAAAFDIVAWDDAEIEMGSYLSDEPRKIKVGLSELLLEAFRRTDESVRPAAAPPAPGEGGNAAPEEPAGREESPPAPASTGPRGAGEEAPGGTEAPREPPAAAPPADRKSNVVPINKEKPMSKLKDLLTELSKLQGVSAVCLVGVDGFLIDSISNAKMEAELVGAIASSGFGASESIGRELGRGLLEVTMLEFEQGPVLISPVGKDFLLVIVAGRDASLGMLRLKIKKLGTDIEAAAEAV